MIAYIPARGGSKRIPRKNIKPLDGKPVISHVIEAVKSLDFIEKVCVSTDDSEIQSIVSEYGAESGDLRRPELSDDFVGFIDLIREDVPRFANDVEDLLFVLPTSALVREENYREACELFYASDPELLMATVSYPITPFWAMVKESTGYWRPVHPELIKERSQDLPETCVDAGLFYMMKWKKVRHYESLMVERLLTYNVTFDMAVDVDKPSDWECLEKLYIQQNQEQ